jgi:hypothetical protein
MPERGSELVSAGSSRNLQVYSTREEAVEEQIQITLTRDEADTLLRLLTDEIPEMNFEVARTDLQDYRQSLAHQRDNLRHLQEQLQDACGIARQTPEEQQPRPSF